MTDTTLTPATTKKAKTKPKTKSKDGEKTVKNKPSIKDINQIIEKGYSVVKDVAEHYGYSVSTAGKIINFVRKNNWKPKTNESALTPGYFMPRTTKEMVLKCMFDRGFIKE